MLARDFSSSNDAFERAIDFLRSIRSNWWVALAGVALSAFIAFAILYLSPTYYRSQASLPLSANAKLVLGSKAFSHKFSGGDQTKELKVGSQLASPKELNGSHGLYRIEATSKDPKQSKDYLTAVINEALALSRPAGSDLRERLDQIRMLENNIPNLRHLYGKLAATTQASPKDTTNIDQIPSTLFSIENDISEKEAKLSSLKRGLEGPSTADVLEWPSEPEIVGGKVAAAVMAALATLILTIVLLYSLFMLSTRNERRSLRNATH